MNSHDENLALFVMLGRSAERLIQENPDTVPPDSLTISDTLDLAIGLPASVRRASRAAFVYKLFFVFENYLRELVIDVLAEKYPTDWWDRVEPNVKKDVADLEAKEETKQWMALGSRDKLSLTTFSQILLIIEHCWKDGFDAVIRDKQLIQEARMVAHLRNAICHMTDIPEEEVERTKQVLRDWFRAVPF
ncbi:MAG TPA: Swt1 family HEPN domain-containing protein [Candidatus Acidoferrales bacterium]|nr:Swt1 family HEPN domain-containing protein [Candidatus Acidoferrum sp.]HEV2298032.1 Swt1 family HEPN domain-containing protein [Candidatus Acidoferrales bacterium]